MLPLNVFPQMWQKWGRPSWCRLATCLSSGPFSVKRCSQNSQLNGRSPVCVRLCLSRLAAVNGETGRVAGQKHSPAPRPRGCQARQEGKQRKHKLPGPAKGNEQHQLIPSLCHESSAGDRNVLSLVSACTQEHGFVPARGTLCPEGLAAEVALEGFLARVRAQVHVEVGFLREGVVAELTHVRPLVPVGREMSLSPLPLPASAPWVSAQPLWEGPSESQPTPRSLGQRLQPGEPG